MSQHMPESEVTNAGPSHQVGLPDFMGVLQRRKIYLVLGAVMGLILGLFYYSTAPRIYQSTAQVWVLKKDTEKPIQSVEGKGFGVSQASVAQDFLDTHRSVLRSRLIVGRAVEKGELQGLESFKGDDGIVTSIIKSLKVEREYDKKSAGHSNSQILNVSFQGRVPEECSIVINAVLDTYQDFLNDSSRGSIKETLSLLKQARDLIQREMEDKEIAWEKFRQNTPVLWKNGMTGQTLYQERLERIDTQRSQLMQQEAELHATLAAVDSALKRGGPMAAMQVIAGLPAASDLPLGASLPIKASLSQGGMGKAGASADAPPAATNTLGRTFESEMVRLQLEEGRLLEVFGAQHPEIVAIRERLQTLQTLMAPAEVDPSKPGQFSQKDLRMMQRMVETKLGQMKQQLKEIRRSQQAQTELFQKELKEAKTYYPYEIQDERFKRSLDRSYFLFDNLRKRMADLDLVNNVGGFDAQVIAPPQPGEKVAPKGSLVFPLALFLGLLGGFGLGCLAEATDKSFHTAEEIRARLRLPLIGHIPYLKQDQQLLEKIEAEGSRLHPMICSHHRPRSRDAEAYRGVRTSLYFSTRGGNYKTIQITSPDMGDGKSTLAANLAVSIAQSGKKVILIDADLRRPQQNHLFGVANEIGFASVLDGSATIAEALQATAVPGLFIVPSGPHPPNPAELLTSHRFKEMLDDLGQQADLLIVDTPPLLAVSDPSVIAPRVDGVILAIRLGKKNRPHAERAREILDTLGAHVLGVVVNAVQRKGGGEYGYGYGGYGYGADGNASYYHDEKHEMSNGTTNGTTNGKV